ncbi:hypothetical protein B0J12DRAFT_552483, partial [Macrophomina phaseolina]
LLLLAFLILYPLGKADFLTSRFRVVKYSDYLDYLIKYKDGRFARYFWWRYVVFNTLMRCDSVWLVKELKAVFILDESPEAQSLLNSIVRFLGSLRGTRLFWRAKR